MSLLEGDSCAVTVAVAKKPPKWGRLYTPEQSLKRRDNVCVHTGDREQLTDDEVV